MNVDNALTWPGVTRLAQTCTGLPAGTRRTDLRREAGGAGEQDLADVGRAQQQLEAADGRGAGADAGGRQHHVRASDRAVLPAQQGQYVSNTRSFLKTITITCY